MSLEDTTAGKDSLEGKAMEKDLQDVFEDALEIGTAPLEAQPECTAESQRVRCYC